MYKLLLLTLLSLFLFNECALNNSKTNWHLGEPLFKIEKDGRFGYINLQGEEIIKPIFRGIGAFTDTLAPARMDGSWGFINLNGSFVIPPIYDYAQSFSEGYALVWKDGKPRFIDQLGNTPWELPDSIGHIWGFSDGIASFGVHKNDQYLRYHLKKNGEIISDSLFEKPWEKDGVISRERNDKTEWALCDKRGKLLVPFGKYDEIKSFNGDLAEIIIEYPKINDYQIGYIDRSGHLRFMLPTGVHIFQNFWSEGLIATRTKRHTSTPGYSLEDDYITWYDTLGKPFLTKFDDSDATDFKNGRAFTGFINNWYLINKKGEQLGPNRFEIIRDNDFSDNMAVVAKHQEASALGIKWYGVIDSMGNYLIQPLFNEVQDSLFQKEGMLVAVNEPLKPEHQSPKYEPIKHFWGLIDRKGNWIFPPKFTKIDPIGYRNGLLYAEIDSLYGYIDPKGDFVWKAIRCEIVDKPVRPDIDFMARAYCVASESGISKEQIKNPNQAQSISKFSGFANHTFGICVKDQESSVILDKYLGFKTYVYNSTSDTLKISCQDNQLYIIMQALNSTGVWKDIEYMPSSWCGNSYYDVKLLPNEYWTFETPAYQGDFCSSLRLKFSWKTRYGYDEQVIYSNEFPGSINLGQFWRKIEDQPLYWRDPFHE